MAEEPLRFVLATNAYGAVKPYYCSSLAETYRHWALEGWPAFRYGLIEGVYTPWARNELIWKMKGDEWHDDTDGILWVEQDHAWHPEDVVEVLRIAKAHPRALVAAPYLQRQSDRLVGFPSRVGLEVGVAGADAVGFGFTFTPWTAFDELADPWFATALEGPDDFPSFVSDDVAFSRKARAGGYELLLAVNARIGHAHEPGPRLVTGAPYK